MLELIQPVVQQLPRTLLNGVTKARGWSGEPLGDHLLCTPPAERSWEEAGVVAGIGSSDKGDGFGARLLAELGLLELDDESAELDRASDRDFVMPQQFALMLNGEVPPIHYGLKVLREFGMEKLRESAERQGLDISSSQGGKRKTAAEMMTLTAAHSPWAPKPDLIRWGASIGTGFALVDFAETGFRFRRELKGRNESNTARNSKAREVTAGPLGKVASLIHRISPDTTPSDITKASERIVRFSIDLLRMDPNHPTLAMLLFTGGGVLDGVDGRHAELTGRISRQGMIDDVEGDLRQQRKTFKGLADTALRRGNHVAATNYALAEALTPLSAYYRAEAESQGLIVAEGGMGTRAWTGILAGVGMQFNKRRDISDVVSGMIVAAKINTVEERRDVIVRGEESSYCLGVKEEDRERFMEDAAIRYEAIEPHARLGMATGALLLARSAPALLREAR
jgi:phosphatidylglycerophosphate synthase